MARQKLLQQQQQALLDERESQLVLREQQLLRQAQVGCCNTAPVEGGCFCRGVGALVEGE